MSEVYETPNLRGATIADRVSFGKDAALRLLQTQQIALAETEAMIEEFIEDERYEMAEGLRRAVKLYQANPQYGLPF